MTPEQARAAEEFRQLRGVDPFGEYLRFRSALAPRLSELAILVTAAHWRQRFEWDIHAPIALTTGISQAIIDALWAGNKPPGLAADQEALYEFCVELHRSRKPDDHVRKRAQAVLGDQGVIDAIGICGYYAMLAMVLNSDLD